MKRAILGGVTSIEHGTYMDDEIFKLMKQNGTWYVPTVTAGKFVAPHSAIFDHAGNIFVVEWVEVGRVTKLRPDVVRPRSWQAAGQDTVW